MVIIRIYPLLDAQERSRNRPSSNSPARPLQMVFTTISTEASQSTGEASSSQLNVQKLFIDLNLIDRQLYSISLSIQVPQLLIGSNLRSVATLVTELKEAISKAGTTEQGLSGTNLASNVILGLQ